ncbi:MAG: OmpL47-type beta-barrel domain-containing protein [Solirubrobacteraceae bacterium]
MLALLVLAAPASAQESYSVSVGKGPIAGAGTVTGTESGEFGGPLGTEIIDCGSDCSAEVYQYERCVGSNHDICNWYWPEVELVASPAAGWQFNGWSGSGCSGTSASCSLPSTSSSPVANFVDVQSPSVSIASPTPAHGTRVHGTVTVAAGASDNWGVQRVDFYRGGVFLGSDGGAPYQATFPTAGLPHGSSQTITARAFDPAGRSSEASRTLVVDNQADGGFAAPTPAEDGLAASRTPQIAFTEASDVESASCGVGGGDLAPCTSPWTPSALDEGEHTVQLQLTDDLGNVTDYSRTFTVDLTGPALTLSGSDGTPFSPGGRPSYTFSATDALSGPAALACSLDSAPFAPCSSPYQAPVTDPGTHTFRVRATDGAGNESVASRTYVIDATPPETRISSGPADGATTGSTVTFGFAAEPGATFRCRVYPAALTPPAFGDCSGPASHTAPGFSPGTYAFEVVATDAFGNVDPTPARRTFTVPGAPVATTPGSGGGGGTTGGPGAAATMLDVGLTHLWAVRGGRARVLKLAVKRLPKGAEVQVRCKGRGCAFKRKTRTAKRSRLVLKKLFEQRKLRAGARVEVRVTMDGYVGKVFRYTVRKGRRLPKSTVLCLAPGASKPARCG